jgi:serine/threonine protein kinase
MPLLQIHCPSCAAEIAAESHFCSVCGHAIVSLSQMPTRGDAAPALPGVSRLISSDSVPVGGFTPGAILADRYRIVGLLGKGGMGEVYRADDLKLGQPVALKFLPKRFGEDPVRRERFFAEVRITRQLAHPNICRVYDIAEFDGQHFLSMEYIDGEDLASLIKRIGYFSSEKGLEIARQLAAGVAAAHDRGVLHRDLKPANIMIDGHGRVRITDFGLAFAASDESQAAEVFGTPAYMAPEQFAGKGASVRSDIYALGLILYEICSGKRAFTATTIAEMRQQKEGKIPTAPSEIREGLDPIVERLIMRCLDRDPGARPASAAHLAAALPGGDPLAAAIAAGETPSPEMVAASGLKEGLRPAVAFGLLAFVIVGAFAAMFMKDLTDLIQLDPSGKPRDVLIERAREIIRRSGYSTEGGDSAFGFDVDTDHLQHFQDSKAASSRSESRDSAGAVFFWYRESPRPLEHAAVLVTDHVSASDPPLRSAGEALVRLDRQGLLRTFEAIPPQRDSASESRPIPDWEVLFSEAGLQHSEWAPAESQWTPAYYADTRTAWQGTFPGSPSVPIAIEAASYRGKPVSFQVIGPWSRANRMAPAAVKNGERITNGILVLLLLTLMAGGLFFARRNLRLGRGDRRGATRLVGFFVVALAISWIFGEHHVPTFWEIYLFIREFTGSVLFVSTTVWTLYIALEPYVRRRWPQVLFSWTRLLSGGWRDPLVGRDVLIGCAAGVAQACLLRLAILAPDWFGESPITLWFRTGPFRPLLALSGSGSFVSLLAFALVPSVVSGIALLFLLFLSRVVLRSERVAAAGCGLVLGLLSFFQVGGSWSAFPLHLLGGALTVYVLMRFGLLATLAGYCVSSYFLVFPMTLHASAWFSSIGFATLFVVLALALCGFWTALGNRTFLNVANIED